MIESTRHPVWATGIIAAAGVALALLLATLGPHSGSKKPSASPPGQSVVAVATAPLASDSAPVQDGVVQQASVQELDVQLGDFFFEPSGFSIRAGQVRATLSNVGERLHTFIVQNSATGGDLFTSERINAGQSEVVEFSLPAGTYRIYCSVSDHADRGQVGTLTAA